MMDVKTIRKHLAALNSLKTKEECDKYLNENIPIEERYWCVQFPVK